MNNIVYKERVVDSDGVAHDKIHGPMPVAEWDEYVKKHNL